MLLLNKKNKKQEIIGISSCFICLIMLLIYCGFMKQQHGEFSITGVSYINNTVTAISSGSYKKSGNEEIINIIDKYVAESNDEETPFLVLNELREKYSVDEIKKFASDAIKNDKEFFRFLIHKTINLGIMNIGTAGYVSNNPQYIEINYNILSNLILPINFALVYMAISISIMYLIWDLVKNKKINWLISFFTILIFANLFTLIVGAPFESQRLFLPSIIPLLLLIGIVVTKKEIDKEFIAELPEVNMKDNNIIYKLFIEKTDDTKIQFFRYLFVGGFAAVINIGSLYIFKEFLHIHYLVANILGFILGLITNYLLSKWLVFAKEKNMNSIIEFIIYTIIGVIGLGLDTLFIWICTDKLNIFYMLSKIISTGLVFIWNFFGRKGIYIIANKVRKGE